MWGRGGGGELTGGGTVDSAPASVEDTVPASATASPSEVAEDAADAGCDVTTAPATFAPGSEAA